MPAAQAEVQAAKEAGAQNAHPGIWREEGQSDAQQGKAIGSALQKQGVIGSAQLVCAQGSAEAQESGSYQNVARAGDVRATRADTWPWSGSKQERKAALGGGREIP